jgi:hypothetical protein
MGSFCLFFFIRLDFGGIMRGEGDGEGLFSLGGSLNDYPDFIFIFIIIGCVCVPNPGELFRRRAGGSRYYSVIFIHFKQ